METKCVQSFRQTADREELETMIHVCACFKMLQQPSAQHEEEEDGEDDDDG